MALKKGDKVRIVKVGKHDAYYGSNDVKLLGKEMIVRNIDFDSLKSGWYKGIHLDGMWKDTYGGTQKEAYFYHVRLKKLK